MNLKKLLLKHGLIDSSTHVYKTKFFLYQYSDTFFRLVCLKSSKENGFSSLKKDDEQLSFLKTTPDEEVQRISLSRTKRNIRELALCNGFEYFATVTVSSKYCDRFSLQACQDLLRKELHKIKRNNKDFKFLFITEKHKNGAFHFHGLVKSLPLYINKNGYFSNENFDNVGFNSFSKIRDYVKCCNYITKYITKDCVKNEDNQIYFCSRGLKKAVSYEIEPLDFPFSFENDFCKIRDFDITKLTQEELLKFGFIKEKK